MDKQNDLRVFFENNTGRLIDKWVHYFEIYELYFAAHRDRPIRLLECGVSHGGSLRMWKNYFHPDSEIIGLDINPACAALAEPGISILIGDQEDRGFLRSLKQSQAPFDIIIDDGGHGMSQQIATFEELYLHLNEGGLYLVEDLHTSYWPEFGGGYLRPGTFVEYAKQMIDHLNAWHSHEQEFFATKFTENAFAMHFYDSVLVVEKRSRMPARAKQTGHPALPETS
jgi:cephalosporin hydroxylase